MPDENPSAPGPVDADQHIDPNAPREDAPQADPRAAAMQAARIAANSQPTPPPPSFNEYDNPAAAVMVTELQEIKARVDAVGTAAMAGLFLIGMMVGLAVFYMAKNGGIESG